VGWRGFACINGPLSKKWSSRWPSFRGRQAAPKQPGQKANQHCLGSPFAVGVLGPPGGPKTGARIRSNFRVSIWFLTVSVAALAGGCVLAGVPVKGAWMPFWKSTAPVAPPEPFARPPLSAPHCELRMGQHELHRDCSAPGPTHRDGHTHTHTHSLTDARTHTLKPKQTLVSPCLCSRRGFV